MRQPSIFNATGYTIAAPYAITGAVAVATGLVEPGVGSNGAVALALLATGVLAAAYVAAGVVWSLLAACGRVLQRRGSLPRLVPGWVMLLGVAVFAPAVAGANLLRNSGGGVEEFLNLVAFFTFATVVLAFAVLLVGTAIVWATQESPRLLEAEAEERKESSNRLSYR